MEVVGDLREAAAAAQVMSSDSPSPVAASQHRDLEQACRCRSLMLSCGGQNLQHVTLS